MNNSSTVPLFDKSNFSRIDSLMRNGIRTEPKTGLKFFTGYAYETLYDWDQYFEAIPQFCLGWDVDLVVNGVLLFLDLQQESGHIRRSRNPVDLEGYYALESNEHVKPFLAQSLLLVLRHTGTLTGIEKDHIAKLRRYLDHWLSDRDPEGNGLSVWQSGAHTGMDTQHERAGWWQDAFCDGVDLNSYLVRECRAMVLLEEYFGNAAEAARFRGLADRRASAIQTRCWDEADGFYYDIDCRTGEKIRVKSVAGFMPMWAGIATAPQAERLVREHLLNPNEFWRQHPVSAYAATEPGYRVERGAEDVGCLWRAHTWMPTNYIVFQGLRDYGFHTEAAELARLSGELVRKSGDREYYTSDTGEGCGLDPFWGWSLLAYFMPLELACEVNPTALDLNPAGLDRIQSIIANQ